MIEDEFKQKYLTYTKVKDTILTKDFLEYYNNNSEQPLPTDYIDDLDVNVRRVFGIKGNKQKDNVLAKSVIRDGKELYRVSVVGSGELESIYSSQKDAIGHDELYTRLVIILILLVYTERTSTKAKYARFITYNASKLGVPDLMGYYIIKDKTASKFFTFLEGKYVVKSKPKGFSYKLLVRKTKYQTYTLTKQGELYAESIYNMLDPKIKECFNDIDWL